MSGSSPLIRPTRDYPDPVPADGAAESNRLTEATLTNLPLPLEAPAAPDDDPTPPAERPLP